MHATRQPGEIHRVGLARGKQGHILLLVIDLVLGCFSDAISLSLPTWHSPLYSGSESTSSFEVVDSKFEVLNNDLKKTAQDDV